MKPMIKITFGILLFITCLPLLFPQLSILQTQGNTLLLAYGLGSIPFGLLTTWIFSGQDVRKIGSGNIGTTNVLRTGKKGLAALTLALDAGKGALAVTVLAQLSSDTTLVEARYFLAGACLIGHIFPVWLDFKGGKGIATGLGVLLALSWPVALITAATWILTAYLTRYSSLAALVAAGLTPIAAYFIGDTPLVLFTLFLAILLLWRHQENIKRLINKTESKIGNKR